MDITLIAALAKNRVIGANNCLPWHLPADLQHFKQCTMHKVIIMGRKTYQSIGKPLPNRRNVILSGDTTFTAPGCEIIHDMATAFSLLEKEDEVMVIGGATVYEQWLPFAKKMYLSYIDAEVSGDCYFPTWQDNQWREAERRRYPADAKNRYAIDFVTVTKLA